MLGVHGVGGVCQVLPVPQPEIRKIPLGGNLEFDMTPSGGAFCE